MDVKGNTKCIGNICSALKGKYKSACGYKWMYYDDYIKLNNEERKNDMIGWVYSRSLFIRKI